LDFIKLADRSDWINAIKRVDKLKYFTLVTHNGLLDVRYV